MFTVKEKNEFILKNYKTMTNAEMATALLCSKSTISNKRKNLGIGWSDLNKQLNNNKEEIISQYKNGRTKKQIAKEFNCSVGFVAKILIQENVKKMPGQIYSFNENYFDLINTSNKAYLLGLICSDGCLYRRDGHQGQLHLIFSTTDLQLLEDIKIEMESNHPIKQNKDNMASLVFVSDKIFNRLLEIGIGMRKTFDLDLKQIILNIPELLFSDFLKGYFDGDGSINQVEKGIAQSHVVIAAPETNCLIFQDWLIKINIDSRYYKDSRKYSQPFGSLSFINTTQKYSFLRYIYKNESVCLKRKKDLSFCFLQNVELNISNRSENIKAVEHYKNVVIK